MHMAGRNGTEGTFDEAAYNYAISPAGADPGNLSDIFKPRLRYESLMTAMQDS